MAWVYLFLAGLCEVGWLVTLKFSNGLTRWHWTTATLSLGLLSLFLVSLALKVLPAGTVYAVWTGIGAVGSAVVGILFFQESRDFWRLFSITLILIGLVGLKLTSGK
ncbi:MAG: multidrug efflux SMR transporter [Verrucomicrobiota bacterium]|jgi:quaternary ammonium compound-resistance protein SugE